MHDPTGLYDGETSPRAGRLARLISVATHAPFVSAVLFVLLNAKSGDAAETVLLSAVTLVTATLIPILEVGYFSRATGNTDGDVARKEDRWLPLMAGMASYAAGTAALFILDAPRISTVAMLSYTLSTLLTAVISRYWKISIHAMGVAGPAVTLSVAYWPWGLVAFLLLPPVMWSRYVRRKHTPAQLVGGAAYGMAFTGIVLWLLLRRRPDPRRACTRTPGTGCRPHRGTASPPNPRLS